MEAILLQYGLPGVCILALVGALTYTVREGKSKDAKYDALQEAYIRDLKEGRDKLAALSEQQSLQNQRNNDLLLTISNNQRRR